MNDKKKISPTPLERDIVLAIQSQHLRDQMRQWEAEQKAMERDITLAIQSQHLSDQMHQWEAEIAQERPITYVPNRVNLSPEQLAALAVTSATPAADHPDKTAARAHIDALLRKQAEHPHPQVHYCAMREADAEFDTAANESLAAVAPIADADEALPFSEILPAEEMADHRANAPIAAQPSQTTSTSQPHLSAKTSPSSLSRFRYHLARTWKTATAITAVAALVVCLLFIPGLAPVADTSSYLSSALATTTYRGSTLASPEYMVQSAQAALQNGDLSAASAAASEALSLISSDQCVARAKKSSANTTHAKDSSAPRYSLSSSAHAPHPADPTLRCQALWLRALSDVQRGQWWYRMRAKRDLREIMRYDSPYTASAQSLLESL